MTLVDDTGEPGGGDTLTSRHRTRGIAQAIGSSESVDGQRGEPTDLATLAEEVIVEHKKYWVRLGVLVAVGTLVSGYVSLVIFLANLSSPGSANSGVRVDVSAQAALGAMAILATVIVALQIAVRSEVRTTGTRPSAGAEAAKILARQRALETVAMLCGMAAAAVGLSATFRALQLVHEGAQIHALAPLVGGLLLAALSADASTASHSGLNTEIGNLKRKQEARALRLALESAPSPTSKRKIFARAVLPSLLALASIAIYAIAIPLNLGAASAFAVAVLGIVTLLIGALLAWFCVSLRLKQKRRSLLAVQIVLGTAGLALAAIIAVAWSETVAAGASKDTIDGTVALTAGVGLPALILYLLSTPSGTLAKAVQRRMEKRLHALEGTTETTTGGARSSVWIWLLAGTTLALPPIGLPIAHYQLQGQHDNPKTVTRLQSTIWVGYSTLTVYAGLAFGYILHAAGGS